MKSGQENGQRISHSLNSLNFWIRTTPGPRQRGYRRLQSMPEKPEKQQAWSEPSGTSGSQRDTPRPAKPAGEGALQAPRESKRLSPILPFFSFFFWPLSNHLIKKKSFTKVTLFWSPYASVLLSSTKMKGMKLDICSDPLQMVSFVKQVTTPCKR